jgi:hypothetical protein
MIPSSFIVKNRFKSICIEALLNSMGQSWVSWCVVFKLPGLLGERWTRKIVSVEVVEVEFRIRSR